MFSFIDLNIPIVANNLLSEANVATVEQGNLTAGSIGVAQGNGSVIGQTTGDFFDIVWSIIRQEIVAVHGPTMNSPFPALKGILSR